MHKRYLICLLDSNILLTIRLFSAQNDIAIRFYFNKATVKYGAFNKHWKEPFYRLLDIRSYFNNAAVKYGAFNKHWKEPVNRHKKEGTTDRKYFLNKVGMERIP